MPKDSSIDSRYREDNPDLAKEQDKLDKGHDLHGAGASVVGYQTPEPPDQAAKTAGAVEAKESSAKATKATAENKGSGKDAPKTVEQVEVTDEGAKKPKRN